MKRIAFLALPLLLCACGATKIRPDNQSTADWRNLHVKVQAQTPEATAQLQDELKRTGLFGDLAAGSDAPPDLVISAVDEKVIGTTTGPFCLDYALAYLTAGIVPEVCDQQYQIDIDVTAPATGRAAQFRAELTQRRFIGLFGLISSAFGDWKFFGPQTGNPVLARGALLDQKSQIDGLLKQ
ncbi:MAG TPA: hypothetical protein VNX47_07535 [Nevskia sp.]|nr:hypothetical protein [Nevskia sp.]